MYLHVSPNRISYAIFLMKKLKDQFSNHDVQLMYDVACLLHKHIQVPVECTYTI